MADPNPLDPDADLHETTASSEEVFSGKLLHVFRDVARVPGHGEAVREWIRHPGAAAVVPLLDGGAGGGPDTVLVRQFRYGPRRVFLEVPAGKMDREGEDPEAVARRELTEETGLVAGRLTPLGPQFPCIGYSSEVIYLYLAEDVRETGVMDLSEGEHVVPVRMPFAEAVARARGGELADMKTTVALLLADAHLRARTGHADDGAPTP